MGSAARRRGAYGGEYMRAGLRLRARVGRRIGKRSSQTRTRKYYKRQRRRRLKQFSVLGQTLNQRTFCCFYRRTISSPWSRSQDFSNLARHAENQLCTSRYRWYRSGERVLAIGGDRDRAGYQRRNRSHRSMLAPEWTSKAGLLCVQVTLAVRGRQKSIGSIGHLAIAAIGLAYARERPKWPARLLLLSFLAFFSFSFTHTSWSLLA
jgi:hypothetical protein